MLELETYNDARIQITDFSCILLVIVPNKPKITPVHTFSPLDRKQKQEKNKILHIV